MGRGQTGRHTNGRTLSLLDRISPVGRFGDNKLEKVHYIQENKTIRNFPENTETSQHFGDEILWEFFKKLENSTVQRNLNQWATSPELGKLHNATYKFHTI